MVPDARASDARGMQGAGASGGAAIDGRSHPLIAVVGAACDSIATAVEAAGIPPDAVRHVRHVNDVPAAPAIVIIDLRDGDPLANAALAYVAASVACARLETILLIGDTPPRRELVAGGWARVVPANRPDRIAAAIATARGELRARALVAQTRAQARRGERRLAAMLAACEDEIAILDARGTVVKGNVHEAPPGGVDHDPRVGASALAELHPDDRVRARDRLAQLVARPDARDRMRVRRRHGDGTYHVFEVFAHNLLHDDEVAGVIVRFRDVTDDDVAQAALRVSEARLELIAARLPIVLWIADPVAGRCDYVSPFFEQLWGRPASDLLADASVWCAGIHADDRAGVLAPTAPLTRPLTYNFRVIRPDGGVSFVDCHRTPVRDTRGQIVHVVGVAIDMTERRALEQQLIEAHALAPLAHLAGSVAHDFNNIIGGTEMLVSVLKSAANDPQMRDDLESISQLTARGMALTRRLLDFVRRRPAVMEPVSVDAVCRGMVGILRLLVGPGVEVSLESPDVLPDVLADRTQLEQMILNLAINARDAMNGRGTLRIAVCSTGATVRLSVEDTGCGMDEATRARVFEPFFTTKAAGSGLGLSTVAAAVRAHRGTIRVQSEVDAGCVFDIDLPIFVRL